MAVQYRCKNKWRRAAVRDTKGGDNKPVLNGIDYLEVSSEDQKEITVHFIHNLPGTDNAGTDDAVPPRSAPALTEGNVIITGGVRIKNVSVVRVGYDSASKNNLKIYVNVPGDFSTYMLRLVTSPGESIPPAGFDPQLSFIEFSFKVNCPNEFDCKTVMVCPPDKLPEPQIDYLAKDYASFRRLMLDRLSVIAPDWKERNPADLGIALVEVLAYAADHLSYYQDAVATEAYLGTARRRVSVRRHARLLDYAMHDGCNARAWVAIQIDSGAEGVVMPGPLDDVRTLLLTKIKEQSGPLHPDELKKALDAGPHVFETMHDITLHEAHNMMQFYTWSDELCCLPKGATRATLRNEDNRLKHLAIGDMLIFEEARGPNSARPEDADPAHRHAVRLIDVKFTEDPLVIENPADAKSTQHMRVVEIQWGPEDALPFPLCLWKVEDRGSMVPVSVARGNVVLVDHGYTIFNEKLDSIPVRGIYRPSLKSGPVTQQGHVHDRENRLVAFDPKAPARAAMLWDMQDVQPSITLLEDGNKNEPWLPRRDLLGSDRFSREFVVEIEDTGRSYLRFGDNRFGRRPTGVLKATYRIGNGNNGNVGAEAIAHVVTKQDGIIGVRNPLPTQGGKDAEQIDQVRLYAPQAFRTQNRAVTENDYAQVAQRYPDVQKAVATLRWTGSWYTMFITVDRRGGRAVDADFEKDLCIFLERYRLAGYDVEIDGPSFVPLDIALTVCVAPGYMRSEIKKALIETFSNVDLPDGRRGFFHPDNFTFNQPVYLSNVVAAAMQVQGVLWVDTDDTPPKPNHFHRWGQIPQDELAQGRISMGHLEIARLDNDPSAPENGKIEFYMEGGL